MKIKHLLLTIGAGMLLFSCNSSLILKRHYNSGYHVDFGKKDKSKEHPPLQSSEQETLTITDGNTGNEVEALPMPQVIEHTLLGSAIRQTVLSESEARPQKITPIRQIVENHALLKPEKKKQDKPVDETKKSRSQGVALILVLLVGILGIHRMYLGYVGIGIIQLLTLGLCGIWTLVDFIMIITGDLKPKNGEYKKTF